MNHVIITVFIGQSDDIVTIKQWHIYILLANNYNETAEPIITQMLRVVVSS